MTQNSSNSPARSARTARFVEWLDKKITALPPGARLPTGVDLAKTFGLSESTIRGVLRTFGRAGKLELVQGSGAFVPDTRSPEIEAGKHHTSSADSITDFVVTSLRRGVLRAGGAIQSVKYMSIRFRVSPATVVQAYRSLEHHGLICRIGKTFWVGNTDTVARPAQGRPVVVFHPGGADQGPFKEDWLAPAYRKLERELLLHGRSSEYRSLGDFALAVDWWMKDPESVPAGVVIGHATAKDGSAISAAVKRLSRWHSMSILVDWRSGDFRILPKGQSIAVLSRGNIFTSRARIVADHAVVNGYRRVVFHFDETRDGFDWLLPYVRIRAELEDMDPTIQFRVSVLCADSCTDLTSFLNRLYQARSAGQIETILSKYHPNAASTMEQELIRVCSPYQLLREPDAPRTLFLFLRDQEAVLAHDQIKGACRVNPPDGVLAFENTDIASLKGISTCVPDWEQMGYLMAHALIRDFPVARSSKGFIRVKVDLLDRGSS